jgi:hypothetical protein
MTYTPPTLVVEVALERGPFDRGGTGGPRGYAVNRHQSSSGSQLVSFGVDGDNSTRVRWAHLAATVEPPDFPPSYPDTAPHSAGTTDSNGWTHDSTGYDTEEDYWFDGAHAGAVATPCWIAAVTYDDGGGVGDYLLFYVPAGFDPSTTDLDGLQFSLGNDTGVAFSGSYGSDTLTLDTGALPGWSVTVWRIYGDGSTAAPSDLPAATDGGWDDAGTSVTLSIDQAATYGRWVEATGTLSTGRPIRIGFYVPASTEMDTTVRSAYPDGPPTANVTDSVGIPWGISQWGDLSPADWTDFSGRVKSYTKHRGRQDDLQVFDPGTVTIVLDNSDRKLDPTWFYSLAYSGLGLGRPLSPVRVSVLWDGDRWPLFYGFLGPEGWPVVRDRGQGSTVTLQAYDLLAVAGMAALPSSPWAAVLGGTKPDWWVRGNSLLSANADGGTFFDEAGSNDAIVDAPGGVFVATDSSLIPADDDPSMYLQAGAALQGPSVASTLFTTSVAFKTAGNLALNEPQILMSSRSGATMRWKAQLYNGQVVATAYSAGTPTGSVTADANPDDGGGRWDDGKPHILILTWDGSYLNLYVDSTSASAAAGVYPIAAGTLVAGGSVDVGYLDELTYWSRVLSGAEIAYLLQAFTQLGLPFNGDTFSERIGRLAGLAGYDVSGLDVLNFHGDSQAYWGADKMPKNLLEAWQGAVEDRGGAVWIMRSGTIRARTQKALTDGTHAASYQTLLANLTNDPDQLDDPMADPVALTRGVVERSGERLDRVINYAEVSLPFGTVGAINPSGVATVSYFDRDSRARYGRRDWKRDTGLRDPATAMEMAGSVVARFKDPPIEVQAVTLEPWRNTKLTDFVIKTLELERAVLLTDLPNETDAGSPIGDAWVASMNVQGEHWQWESGIERWTVTVDLARNGADDPPEAP